MKIMAASPVISASAYDALYLDDTRFFFIIAFAKNTQLSSICFEPRSVVANTAACCLLVECMFLIDLRCKTVFIT